MTGLRRVLPYTTAALILTAMYTGWTMYSRYRDPWHAERNAKEREAGIDRKIVEMYGGDKLTILSFSATAAMVRAGERVGLCYGVSNAVAVKIEPGVEPLQPALTHCTEAFPRKTTTFTLTATDNRGQEQSASLTVRVR